MDSKIPITRKGKYGYVNQFFEADSRLTQLQEFIPMSQQTWLEQGETTKTISSEEDIDDDHRIPLKKLLRKYRSNISRGLSTYQVMCNRGQYGHNILTAPPKPSELLKFARNIALGLNFLIWICVILSLGSYGVQFLYSPDDVHHEALYFAIVLILVCIISGASFYYQEYKSCRVMDSFINMAPKYAIAKRNGRLVEINVQNLVVGDIIEVKYGDIVPADMRIIECHEFHVDNSSLTGESDPQRRLSVCTDFNAMMTKNLAFFSTNVIEGNAKGIVIKVGSRTVMGKVANVASTVIAHKSPIAVEMESFIFFMTIRSLIFGVTFFGVAKIMGYGWIDSVYFVVAIIVANVPEGLALTFTMVLALTAKKMASRNCLVKNLQAVETLGSTSVICSDKTGTLTQNKMSVAHMWFNNEIAESDTSEFITGTCFDIHDPGFIALSRVAALCSRARFKPGQAGTPILKRNVDGDASESAILKCMEIHFKDMYGGVDKYRTKFIKLCEIPFNYRDKYQTFVYDMRNENDPRHFVAIKGAPERILGLCNRVLVKDKEFILDNFWIEQIHQVIADIGQKGERLIGFADCFLQQDKYYNGYKYDPEKPVFLNAGLRFVGLMSLIDPPHAAVPEAISKIRSAGIKVIMVTGDHPVTATAIARAVGIISPGSETIEEIATRKGCRVENITPESVDAAVITGCQLKNMSTEELHHFLKSHKEIVFARASPDQKQRIVEAYQDLGHVVAATGDGVNDSPALKKADIGIAMGLTGTEVSKATADMILLDDNFTTIVTGVEEGRLIFDNLKKLLQYNLTDNIAEMYSIFVFILFGCPLPMGLLAMLFSVLGTDIIPAISIVYETAEADIMKLKPRHPTKQTLVTPQLLSYTYGQMAVFEVTAGFLSYFVSMGSYGFFPLKLCHIKQDWESRAINDLQDSYGQEWSYYARHELELHCQTAFFISIVIMQVANVIICKTRRKSIVEKKMTNWMMNIAIVLELSLAAAFIYIPCIAESVGFRSLRLQEWLVPIPFAVILIIYDECRRYFSRRMKNEWLRNEMET